MSRPLAGTHVLRWVGPLLVVVAGVVAGAVAKNPIGWALAAGSVLLLVLGRVGKRVLGIALTILAVMMAGFALTAEPREWLAGVLALVGVVGAGLVILTADAWGRRRSRFERGGAPVDAEATPLEVWKAMDEGHDPTAVDPR